MNFEIDPLTLDRVGVLNGDLWMIERYLADLLTALLSLMQAMGDLAYCFFR
ncbi:hypothetical protein M992_2866 [Moellerella wisconsensis ATCC 35017]|uniref:Uncharacterized protein n=1 Tax=Moellerella wisconsensis ATCC 35017 TaxID=1354267 RepID=A0A0N1KI70_9GAMM|nr:hypothetical protein M992_2866 [Moellerella wisconsensis ATCC 35017]